MEIARAGFEKLIYCMNTLIKCLSFVLLAIVAGCDSDNEPIRDIVINPVEDARPQVVKNLSHPGILFTYNDLARIRRQAYYNAYPWKLCYDKLKGDANFNYVIQGPYEEAERNGADNTPSSKALSRDSQMSFHCALMWVITGEKRYAQKSIEILNAWSGTLKAIIGNDDMLEAAWYGFNLVNAAEILRYTDSGWAEEDIARAEKMFRDIFYDLIKDWKRGWAGNWDTAITKMQLGIGVFLDDREIFDRAIDFYLSTEEHSNGTLYGNIYDSGQNYESGRDQTHAQYGINHLAEACEVAWSQDIDLYSAMNKRLLLGYEYVAKYNLGYDVPYVANHYGSEISGTERGIFQPGYEIVYNHYHNRMGLPESELPYTTQVVMFVREDGGEGWNAICLGLGSLLFNDNDQ